MLQFKRDFHYFKTLVGSAAYFAFASKAQAIGFAQIDSESFFLNSPDRGNSSTTLTVGPQLTTEGKYWAASLNAEAKMFLQDASSFTPNVTDAYVATSRQLSALHQVSIGRRQYDWSVADDVWKMGIWSPRFNWDPLRPEQVGLTGLFYTYESQSWRVLVYGSPISIPESGYPLRSDLTSASPDNAQPFSSFVMEGQTVPIHYNVVYPSISSLIVHPTAGVSVRYGQKQGAWGSAAAGVMPLHQVVLGVEPQLAILPASQLDVNIHPTTIVHELATAEAGFRGPEWSLWASATGESPVTQPAPSSWITNPIGPALIASAGADYRISSTWTFKGSYLWINEDTSASQAQQAANSAATGGNFSIALPARFNYTRAMKVGGDWTASSAWDTAVNWVFDIAQSSSLITLDCSFTPGKRAWLLGVGGDFFMSSTGQGQIGQYVGDDRIRARIAYAF